jgi:Sulfotransferase family
MDEAPVLRPALFLHIQKTAGTSIQVLARRNYGNDGVCSHDDFLTLGREGCARYPFISGHFGFDFARPLMPGRFCFTFLRQPQARLISFYNYSRAQPRGTTFITDAALENDLDGFLRLADRPDVEPFLYNNMAWQLFHGLDQNSAFYGEFSDQPIEQRFRPTAFPDATLLRGAKANLRGFDYVGLTETADSDIRLIFHKLGASLLHEPRHNESSGPNALANLPRRTRQLLADLTQLDQKLYDHACRWHQQHTRFLLSWLKAPWTGS